jgi:predicted glycoside hydrolase/deacetylase ChbG (UPF0249 family)
MRKLIVTGDDFGISQEINNGIIESFQIGILRSTALLVNAPKTLEAVSLARRNPGLEVGLHLSFVEGITLSRGKSLIDPIRYFEESDCLLRHWTIFLKKLITNQINLRELEVELEMQILKFLEFFPSIPFINSTQHIHLFPVVNKIFLKLCQKYKIKNIRVPLNPYNLTLTNKRSLFFVAMCILGRYFRYLSIDYGPFNFPDAFLGFNSAGHLSSQDIKLEISNTKGKIVELMAHPGFFDENLKNLLPWAYSDFHWDQEMKALIDRDLPSFISENEFELSHFQDAFGVH